MLTTDTNFAAVVHHDHVSGRAATELSPGAAWLLGALLIRTQQVSQAVVTHDGDTTSELFARTFLRGVINADSWAARATYAGTGTLDYHLWCQDTLSAPGGRITTTDDVTSIRLYRADGHIIGGAALADLGERMAINRAPLPVNDQAKGTIEDRAAELQQAWATTREEGAG
ncbi:hypothetical protein ABIA33_001431 [Streptacidiphilus sp. MAP12-16]|uniref:hypothetical protein n=1 Tax=Streptacidiphilus sp. MAP12-16 TaxID=3156300 RepID=UPI0035193938